MESDGPKHLDAFYSTYESSHLRSGSSRRPLAFFHKMSEKLARKNWMKIFVAHHEGNPIGSILLLCYKDALTYYAGGVDYAAQLLRPHPLLFWETLKWAQRAGWRWYEMGPHFPYLSKENKMARIGYFKQQFGGREFPLFEGVLLYHRPLYYGGTLIEEAYRRFFALYRRIILMRRS